jgi:hypothetical protein
MATLIQIAAYAQDQFYQDFPDRKGFFVAKDFKYHCAAKYSEMLNILYQAARKENKQETGFSSVEIPAQWLITEKIEEDKLFFDKQQGRWYCQTTYPIFSFDFDSFGNGLNGIRPYGNSCNLKKISNQEIRFYDVIPQTPDIYYFLENAMRIDFLKKPTFPILVYYIPQVLGSNDQCVMSDNIVSAVIQATLELMFGAKQGMPVVKEADDGNRNAVMPQQVNPNTSKAQQVG